MIPKNLLTIEQIQKAAEKSDLAALKCSLKHWRQIGGAEKREYDELFTMNKIGNSTEWCACCHRWLHILRKTCSACPLTGKGEGCCRGNYFAFVADPARYHRPRAKAVADYIEKVIKNYKEKK